MAVILKCGVRRSSRSKAAPPFPLRIAPNVCRAASTNEQVGTSTRGGGTKQVAWTHRLGVEGGLLPFQEAIVTCERGPCEGLVRPLRWPCAVPPVCWFGQGCLAFVCCGRSPGDWIRSRDGATTLEGVLFWAFALERVTSSNLACAGCSTGPRPRPLAHGWACSPGIMARPKVRAARPEGGRRGQP
jgi:hypothetical protein